MRRVALVTSSLSGGSSLVERRPSRSSVGCLSTCDRVWRCKYFLVERMTVQEERDRLPVVPAAAMEVVDSPLNLVGPAAVELAG